MAGLTEEEKREHCKKWIEEHTNRDIDWDDPPSGAAIALERLVEYDPTPGVGQEQIDDVQTSYISYQGLDPVTLQYLQDIKKLDWS